MSCLEGSLLLSRTLEEGFSSANDGLLVDVTSEESNREMKQNEVKTPTGLNLSQCIMYS